MSTSKFHIMLTTARLAAVLMLCPFASLCLAGPEEDYQAGRKSVQAGDIVNAMATLKRAADQGHVRAQTLFAYILDFSEENEDAVKYYRMAANQGDPEGELGLGLLYAAGKGVAKNNEDALNWIKKAAEKNYQPAINVLADAYWAGSLGLGEEGKRDNAQALLWIMRAAEKDYLPAVKALAQAHRQGLLGLNPDPEQATLWEAKLRTLSAPPGKDAKGKKK